MTCDPLRQVGVYQLRRRIKNTTFAFNTVFRSQRKPVNSRKSMMTRTLLRSQAAVRRINFLNPRRYFFHWLTVMFNRVDEDRVKELGPDRVCAEWLLRNGASVKWKGVKDYIKDYNLLPGTEEKEHYYIEAADATDSAISDIGFPHFKGCRYIEEIKLVRCAYIENEALPLLRVIKESLNQLEIVDCYNITEEGLYSLQNLWNLKKLRISGTPYVKDRSQVLNKLQKSLPNCNIQYDE
ncbi:ATP synthase subunit s, mitochondrial isoform X2 [Cephus cinctus]|uniref:ATP synthase subunit s, mitochondrial isoform X2 n=1 Tax=Cephus cinctus TaxID=211228 RepID=A0AAJ7BP88_CEPCN|nr:ATP synthase subunit s, mitochondrial isoform X2 [Cephus cinctus]